MIPDKSTTRNGRVESKQKHHLNYQNTKASIKAHFFSLLLGSLVLRRSLVVIITVQCMKDVSSSDNGNVVGLDVLAIDDE